MIVVHLGLGDQAENRQHTTTLAKYRGGSLCPIVFSFGLFFQTDVFYDDDGELVVWCLH